MLTAPFCSRGFVLWVLGTKKTASNRVSNEHEGNFFVRRCFNPCFIKKKVWNDLSHEKRVPGWLGFIGDYTIQLYGDFFMKDPY